MGVFIGKGRKARVAYGFDDIAIAPSKINERFPKKWVDNTICCNIIAK